MNTVDIWLAIARANGLGPIQFNHLLDSLKTPENILGASHSQLSKLGLKPATITSLQQPDTDAIELERQWLEQENHHLVSILDPRYPERLKTIADAPIVLYVRGDPDYLCLPQLAMVGSRTPTASGRKTAMEFASHLSKAGITITSGLARGIDGASHQGALEGIAGTLAVVAHGLDVVYPAAHRQLAEAITHNGAVVSEFPIGTAPNKGLFPRRNRIISALSLGTLVVEAALKSGSLITAKHALEQGREVFAIPGSIHNPLARGCHQLIRQGAKLVETADDILVELSALLPTDIPATGELNSTPVENNTLDRDHQKLLKCLAYEPAQIDELVDRSGFTASEVASMLLILELEGCVVSEGGLYTRIA
jgi:DNA processing protein